MLERIPYFRRIRRVIEQIKCRSSTQTPTDVWQHFHHASWPSNVTHVSHLLQKRDTGSHLDAVARWKYQRENPGATRASQSPQVLLLHPQCYVYFAQTAARSCKRSMGDDKRSSAHSSIECRSPCVDDGVRDAQTSTDALGAG